uniref:Uncharacterized protein n=1 Tax=Kalanchoe fedtschenkoi TaxID=63787 RepID=A0A7N0TC24_KALFE
MPAAGHSLCSLRAQPKQSVSEGRCWWYSLKESESKCSTCVLSAGTTYVDKTHRHETADLWHARLAHASPPSGRLKVMMKRFVAFLLYRCDKSRSYRVRGMPIDDLIGKRDLRLTFFPGLLAD